MAVNKFKNHAPSTVASTKIKKGKPWFSKFNINAFYIFDNIHFVFQLAFLGVVYIANSHYAVQTIKDIKSIQSDLRKVSWESNSKKSDLMYQSMESVVAEKVKHMGLAQQTTNPKKIINKKYNKD